MNATHDNRPLAEPGDTDTMEDDEFLHYCLAHAETKRCGFTPQQLRRLMLLAGMNESAGMISMEPPRVMECDYKTITEMVLDARLKEEPKT